MTMMERHIINAVIAINIFARGSGSGDIDVFNRPRVGLRFDDNVHAQACTQEWDQNIHLLLGYMKNALFLHHEEPGQTPQPE